MRLVASVWMLWPVVCVCCASAVAWVSLAYQNVYMVSDTGWTTGDTFLQRQHEPSMAVSTRSNLHRPATTTIAPWTCRVFWGLSDMGAGRCPALNSLDRRAIRGQNPLAVLAGSCATRRRDHWLRNASVVSARAKTSVNVRLPLPDRRFLFRVLVEIPREERTITASLAT